jgi:hypothetical protein
MPYLMGIEDSLMKEAEDNINDGTYIINLDSDTVVSKAYSSVSLSSAGKFKPQLKDDLPDLPGHYTKKLLASLEGHLKNFNKSKK